MTATRDHDSNPLDLNETRVGDAMSPGTITCDPQTSLSAVAQMMAAHRIHCIVVVRTDEVGRKQDQPWGIVSDLDLVKAVGTDLDVETAGDTAGSPVVTISLGDTLEHAAQLMSEHDTDHLIVVGAESRYPIGVLSTLDIARAIAKASSAR